MPQTPAAAPGALIEAALFAFAAPDLAPTARRDAILAAVAPLADAPDEAALAGAYGALHALAAVGDALTDDASLRAAIAGRSAAWREAGAELLALHSGDAPPWPLVRVDLPPPGGMSGAPRLLLRAQKPFGTIRVDAIITLCNTPLAAWAHGAGDIAVLDREFEYWRARANDASLTAADYDAMIRRIGWLCRVGVETRRILARHGA